MKKKVLVTGADGFIGSHLVEKLLLSDEYEVKALVQYNSMNSWGWLDEIKDQENLEVVLSDIRDPNHCREFTKGIDIIFHLAALIAIPYSYHAPYQYIDTNVNGTMNLCQAAKDNKVSNFIHVSTSEVYGTAEYVPIDEKHPMQPQSPYSASKVAADAVAMSYYYSFGLPVTIARPFNTYGPRQSARAIIPSVITQILAKEEALKIGDQSPTRDFNYVGDTCKGLVLISKASNLVGKAVNIGSNSEISIGDLISKIKKLMSSDINLMEKNDRIRPKKSEVYRLKCDNTLLVENAGFKSDFTLDEGLLKTIDWYADTNNLKLYKTKMYTI